MSKQSDNIAQICSKIATRLRCLPGTRIVLQFTNIILVLGSALLVTATSLHLVYPAILFILAVLINNVLFHIAYQTSQPGPGNRLVIIILRYSSSGIFFLALGISAFQLSGSRTYVYLVLFSFFLWGYMTLLMARYVSDLHGNLSQVFIPGGLKRYQSGYAFRFDSFLLKIYQLSHSWLLPLSVLLFCALELSGTLFLVSFMMLTINTLFILRLLGQQETEQARAASRSGTSFLFYMFGVSILLILIARLPFNDVLEAVRVVGPEIMWLLVVPVIWIIPYALTLQVLLDYRVSFRDALYTQISGDAFNSITPLLGMGGEPYKAKHLSNFVSLEDSSRAIVQSRLIHALSGVLFAAIVILITVFVVDLSHITGFTIGLGIVAFIMFAASGLLLWITMSRAPTRITSFLLSRFRVIEEFRHDRLSWKTLWITMLYKIIGRTGKFLELYVIFLVLNITPTFADMVLVEAMIMVSISIFFFVPQGLGVNEAGIVTAFTIAGYAAATGVVFGLIRRARMVVYALFGLLVYLVGTTTRFGKSRYLTTTVQTEKQSV